MVQLNETTGISIGGKTKDSLPKTSYFFSIPDMIFSNGPAILAGRILHSCGIVQDSSNPSLR